MANKLTGIVKDALKKRKKKTHEEKIEWISGSDLFLYNFCWTKLSNEFLYDDEKKYSIKEPMKAFIQFLMSEGKRFETKVVDKLVKKGEDVPKVRGSGEQARYDHTIHLMQEGHKYIYQANLMDHENHTMGIPDLLIRIDGIKSKIGGKKRNYQYQPIDIKSSHEPKGEQIAQVVHYLHLLESMQGSRPQNAFLYNQSRGPRKVFEIFSFENGGLDKLERKLKRLSRKRLDLKKEVEAVEDDITSLKETYQDQRKDTQYYETRRELRSQLMDLRKKYRAAQHKEEPVKYQIKITEKSDLIEKEYPNILSAIRDIKSPKERPTPTICSDCVMCEYIHHCYDMAVKNQDISIVSGVGKSKKVALNEKGVMTVDDMLEVEDLTTLRVPYKLGEKTIKNIRRGALAWKKKAVLSYKDNAEIEKYDGTPLEFPDIPEPKVAIQIDFEEDEASNNIIMIGQDIRGYSKLKELTLFAEKPSDEFKILKEFCDFVKEIDDDVKFFHYSHYEKTHFQYMFDTHYNKLLKEYGNDLFDIEDKIMDNLVDLLPYARKCLAAPIHSNSIKVLLPKVFDFHWREDERIGKVDGAEFEVLYKQFTNKATPKAEKEILKKVMIEYNQDDVRGPWRIYDKMVELKNQK